MRQPLRITIDESEDETMPADAIDEEVALLTKNWNLLSDREKDFYRRIINRHLDV